MCAVGADSKICFCDTKTLGQGGSNAAPRHPSLILHVGLKTICLICGCYTGTVSLIVHINKGKHMELNKFQAAKAAGISRTTLDRHIKQGKVSTRKDGRNRVVIDLVELERVYTDLNIDTLCHDATGEQSKTVNLDSVLQQEINALRERLVDLETERTRERHQLQEAINDLREDRDHWREQAKQATALLEDKRERKQTHGGFFSLFSRGN